MTAALTPAWRALLDRVVAEYRAALGSDLVALACSGSVAMELEAVRQRLRQLGSRRIERPDGSWYWDLKPDWRPGETIEL